MAAASERRGKALRERARPSATPREAGTAPGRAIRRLPEHVANQIAAGEVVERPASVVKELVENALDAGSRRIEVEIKEGGREYIRVRDDGWGIAPEEVLTAFERHATSKIEGADDLFAVTTLGFRGEALPSIASVSDLEILTRRRGDEAGTRVRLEGGRPLEHGPVGCSPGTTVIVRRLFFNTPARYKFLRSPAAEGRQVLDTMGRLALAHPHCAFTLIVDGRRALQTPGDGDMRAAVAAVFGRRVAEGLVPVRSRWSTGRLHGWIARPPVHRGNRDMEVICLNGRPIHAPALVRAVEKGYETLLPSRRFPVAVLHLEMDPAAVDVNVHPTKREVRFADERELFRIILGAVREALLGENLVPSLGGGPPAQEALPLPREVPATGEALREDPAFAGRGEAGVEAVAEGLPLPFAAHAPSRFAAAAQPRTSRGGPCAGERRNGEGVTLPLPYEERDRSAEDYRHRLREIQLLGTLDRVFLIGLAGTELWIIDQHVAHERVLYERFLARPGALGHAPMQQRLLQPLVMEFGAGEAARLLESLPRLQAAGFALEPFGPGAFRLTGVPANLSALPSAAVEEALRESLAETDGAGTDGEGGDGGNTAHGLAATLACRLAVKAGEHLPLEAARRLLADLAEADNPFTCPHGRPIVIAISRRELERRFYR